MKNKKMHPIRFLFYLTAAICLGRFLIQLPTTIKLLLLLIVGIGPGRSLFIETFDLCKSLFQPVKAGAVKVWGWIKSASSGYDKAARIVSKIWGMSDEEFEEKFGASEDRTAKPSAPAPLLFLPASICMQAINNEQAAEKAAAWWNDEDETGSGEEKLAELISSIVTEDPTKSTCLLNEYRDELRLPVEAPVLSALIEILKENGIAADLTADEELIISWGQTMDGLEAGQY